MTELSTKAIRIHLLWGYWNPEKTDKKVTNQTNQAIGVRGGRGHYDKSLFSDEWMKPLRQHTSKTKAYYYAHTLPWEDRVARLISTRTVESVAIELNRAVMTYDEILSQTVGSDEDYDQAVISQQSWLGSAWNKSDYPTREEFMQKYHGMVRILPLTAVSDLRCELSDGLRQQIINSVKQDMEERFRMAMADCWRRLYEPVRKMAEVLSDRDAKFKDTLVHNVREVCDVLPELNILCDPALAQMAQEVKNKLITSPDRLRDSMVDREEYAKRAGELADILGKMGL